MLSALLSLLLLLFFAELASANFKRLAPVLEAWDQSKRVPAPASLNNPFPWKGGWEKLAALVWALGVSIPLLAFALACHLFLDERAVAANLVMGSVVGSNVLGLTLAFGVVLISGPVTFFRVRSVTSPVFLLLATVAFAYTSLNARIGAAEGLLLLFLLLAYGIYFRRFSSEWKHYERTFSHQQSLLESTEGILPILAVLCMGVGFFLLAVLVAYPFVQEIGSWSDSHGAGSSALSLGAHLVAAALAAPWLARCLYAARAGSTAKAATISSISHSCLLNVLLLPALAAFLGANDLAPSFLSLHLPAVFVLTGIFVSALLIEKEKGGRLPWILFVLYLGYTGIGLKF